MTESEGEIEYLEEDAEIVQQCVQTVQLPEHPAAVTATAAALELTEKLTPLLVERPKTVKRKKRKKDEEDSDYDPNADFVPPSPPSPPSPRNRKKKLPPTKKIKNYHRFDSATDLKKSKVQDFGYSKQLINRKKNGIRIPDYDDPLCLPVRAIKQEAADLKRLDNWNNVCMEHFKHCDTILKPERGETSSSTRTIVFRNVVNKQSGKVETTIWSKTCVKNEDAERKAEIFQCVLPRYKEKQLLKMYNLTSRKSKPFYLVDEVILTKEDHKDRETLVVYKPREGLSAVYTMVDDRKTKSEKDDEIDNPDEEEVKVYLKELTCSKVCAACFQTSWRGVNKNEQKNLVCPICNRTYITVYNLLAHFKNHSPSDVQKYRQIISSVLGQVVDYHYKCRICREQFNSIKLLRQHVTTHKGTEPFVCEVGNHTAR